ncbi:hypothetical protein [Streptomyces sp. NPDC050287]|uniref:hypothetical protein n=1 Tax=Streptomyces sp. NPDC050287 TaxID=3365608 RepID=UPI00379D3787
MVLGAGSATIGGVDMMRTALVDEGLVSSGRPAVSGSSRWTVCRRVHAPNSRARPPTGFRPRRRRSPRTRRRTRLPTPGRSRRTARRRAEPSSRAGEVQSGARIRVRPPVS